ncbi:MAG: hypothetical protein ABW104_09375 [Candidatus Thiodiazotropha sp. 6PLUC2]
MRLSGVDTECLGGDVPCALLGDDFQAEFHRRARYDDDKPQRDMALT